jgi:hypothetical protein
MVAELLEQGKQTGVFQKDFDSSLMASLFSRRTTELISTFRRNERPHLPDQARGFRGLSRLIQA